MSSDEESAEEDEEEKKEELPEEKPDLESEAPESAPKKKKARNDDEMTRSIKRVLEKKFNQRKANFGKHRNIDKSSGVEHLIAYAGTTFKITDYKLRPQKPRPKNYPEKTNGLENGDKEEFHAKEKDNPKEENKTENKVEETLVNLIDYYRNF